MDKAGRSKQRPYEQEPDPDGTTEIPVRVFPAPAQTHYAFFGSGNR